jgi:hypothetical protein
LGGNVTARDELPPSETRPRFRNSLACFVWFDAVDYVFTFPYLLCWYAEKIERINVSHNCSNMGRRSALRAQAHCSAVSQVSSANNIATQIGKVMAITAGSALALYLSWISLKKLRAVMDPTRVHPSCPSGNCAAVPQPILDIVERIERNEHRDPFIEDGGALPLQQRSRGEVQRDAQQQQHVLEFPLPTVLVDLASFRQNVRTMARIALASGKQVRIGTKSLRVPALIQLAADIIESEAQIAFQDRLSDRQAAPPAPRGGTVSDASATVVSSFIKVDELDEEADDVDARKGASSHRSGALQQPRAVAGLMTYSAAETLFWAKRIASGRAGADFASLLLAYPIADAYSAHLFVDAILTNPSQRVVCAVVVDCESQLLMLADAAKRAIRQERYLSVDGFDGVGAALEVNVVLEIDMSYRPFVSSKSSSSWFAGWVPHLGARRSPLRNGTDITRMLHVVSAINQRCQEVTRNDRVGLRFKVDGIMGYEAQIAGVQDAPFGVERTSWWSKLYVRGMHIFKKASMHDVVVRRKECIDAVEAFVCSEDERLSHQQPATPPSTLTSTLGRIVSHSLLVNGGGSGSLLSTVHDPVVTEVTIGSGALCGHLFDRFVPSHQEEPISFVPAIFVAIGVNRIAEPPRSRTRMHNGVIMATQIVACHGGGYVASGSPAAAWCGGGNDRVPIVVHPPFGMCGIASEGFGEVQTPFEQHCSIVAPGQESSVMVNTSSVNPVSISSTSHLGVSSRHHSVFSMLPLTVGDVVLLRPAKSGEIAEHFDEYLLVDSSSSDVESNIVGGRHVYGKINRVPTYRGFGSLAS